VRQVFYLAGMVTVFAGLLAAVLMRSPASADASSEFAKKEEEAVTAAP